MITNIAKVWHHAKTAPLLNHLVREPVASLPVRTLRAPFTFRIVDALLMGTANDSVRHHDAGSTISRHKGRDLLSNGVVEPHIDAIRKPAAEIAFSAFLDKHGHSYFGGKLVGRPIKGDGRYR